MSRCLACGKGSAPSLSERSRSGTLRQRGGAERELPHEGEQALRLLDLWKVTSFWDQFEASVGERLGIGMAIHRVEDTIALSPRNQDWDVHALEPALQL